MIEDLVELARSHPIIIFALIWAAGFLGGFAVGRDLKWSERKFKKYDGEIIANDCPDLYPWQIHIDTELTSDKIPDEIILKVKKYNEEDIEKILKERDDDKRRDSKEM